MNTPADQTKFIAYYRVSTDKQGKSQLGGRLGLSAANPFKRFAAAIFATDIRLSG